MQRLKVSVITPDRLQLSVDADMLCVSSQQGDLALLPEHAELLAQLRPGKLSVRGASDGEPHTYFVGGGLLRVEEGEAVVLADVLEKPEDIDVDRANRSEARADERLRGLAAGLEVERALASKYRAQARLRLCGAGRM